LKIENCTRILIIRFSSLGDLLLTTPLVRSIRKCNPNLIIDFILREEYEDVYKNNPNINDLFILKRDGNLSDIIEQIQKNQYDLVIDLHNNLRSRKLSGKINCEVVRFNKPTLNKFLLVNFKINRYKERLQIPQMYAGAVEGVELDANGMDLFLPDNFKSGLTEKKSYIGFCPGSKHFTKRWPEEYFVQLGNQLSEEGFQILIFGGKDDKEICEHISSRINGAVNLSNDNELFKTAADMKMCKAIVCNDSGLMHTASALQIPLITIFGSSVEEFGFTPYNSPNLILENKSLSCRPCSHIGRSACSKKHFECMKKITPSLVANNLNKLLIKYE